MKKTKNSASPAGSWDLFYILEGEPNGCHLALSELKTSLNSKVVSVEDIESFKSSCKSFQLGKTGTIVLVHSPKAEMLASLLDMANSTSVRCNAVVVYYPGAYADKRTSFVSEAHKRKRVCECSYYLTSDVDFFRDYLSNWESRSGVKIAVKAKPWLIANAATKKADVRGAKGAKEEVVYDMPALESDLNKLAHFAIAEERDILSVDDLDAGICRADTNNQWEYCDAFILGSSDILTMPMPEQNYVGLTRMLASQCLFAAHVKGHGQASVTNPDAVAQSISGADIAARYTFLGGKSDGYKKIHPFRVKMAAKKFQDIPLSRITKLIDLCNSATCDMLNGCSHAMVYNAMLMASLNQMTYYRFSR